jgi:hypothetical protein
VEVKLPYGRGVLRVSFPEAGEEVMNILLRTFVF